MTQPTDRLNGFLAQWTDDPEGALFSVKLTELLLLERMTLALERYCVVAEELKALTERQLLLMEKLHKKEDT